MTSAWDPYALLGLARDADEVTVRACRRFRALECHPDRPGGSTARMQAINKAFGILIDPRARAAWDAAAGKDTTDGEHHARPDPGRWSSGAPSRPPSSRTQRHEEGNRTSADPLRGPTGVPSAQASSAGVALRLCQWSAVAVFVAGLQEVTIGGGEALMAVAAVILAVRAVGSHHDAGQPFWPIRDVKVLLRTVFGTAFAGVR